MPFFTAKPPKSRAFRAAYREEIKTQKAERVRKEAREQARRDLMTPKERRAAIKQNALGSTAAPVKAKDRIFKNLGGSITIRKDALQRLKRIGR